MSQANREISNYSPYFLLIFFISLILMFSISEVFKRNSTKSTNSTLLNSPIRADILANIKTMKIKNNLGSFTLTQDSLKWYLTEPRLMPAKENIVTKILESLKETDVLSIHDKDSINLNNFALENPNLTIDLFSALDEQLKINIGLINPINNSAYITVNGVNKIYQISSFKSQIQTYKLSDFIDSSIFSFLLNDVTEFKLYNREFKDPTNHLRRSKTNWKSKKYNSITKENVDKKLQKIFNMRTHMIIDKQNKELKTLIANYLEKPLYKIKIKTKKKSIEYKASSLIKSLPGLKLEKRQYFLMTSSDRDYTYVISKNFLKEFYIRYSDLK